MSNEVRDYLSYVKDVLGVAQVILPVPLAPEEAALAELARTKEGPMPLRGEYDVLILHRGEGLFHGESADLWNKMKGAMHLGSRRVLELETDHADTDRVLLKLLEDHPATVSLVLSPEPARSAVFRALGVSKVIESFVPSLLVQNADLKRGAWNDLQLVMKELGIKN